MYVVLALVRAEKQRQKKSRPPPTPHNLSIHKDVGSDEDKYEPSTRPEIAVVKSDGKEVFMGETSLSFVLLAVQLRVTGLEIKCKKNVNS